MMRAHGLTSDSLDERDLLAAVRRAEASGMTPELVSLLLVRGAGSWSVGVRSMELCPLRRHGGRSEFDASTAEVTTARTMNKKKRD